MRLSLRLSSITPIVAPVGALLLLFAAAAPARAADWSGRGRLSGVVTDEATKKPIAGALVTLRKGEGPDAGPAPIKTDKKGRWSYLGLTGGDWTVEIQAEGYAPSGGSTKVDEFAPNQPIQIALPTAASVAPKEDPAAAGLQKTIDSADSLFQQKKLAEARAEYEKALPELEGNNRLIVLKRIASCQMLEGNDEGAVTTLKEVLTAAPTDPEALRLIIDRLFVLKRNDEAKQYMAQMPEGQGLGANTLINIGINSYNAGNYDEAIEKFNEILASDPNNFDGYFYRGRAKLAQSKIDEAKADFAKALELDPGKKNPNAAECQELYDALKK